MAEEVSFFKTVNLIYFSSLWRKTFSADSLGYSFSGTADWALGGRTWDKWTGTDPLHNKGTGTCGIGHCQVRDTQAHGRRWGLSKQNQDFHAFGLWEYKPPRLPPSRGISERYCSTMIKLIWWLKGLILKNGELRVKPGKLVWLCHWCE